MLLLLKTSKKGWQTQPKQAQQRDWVVVNCDDGYTMYHGLGLRVKLKRVDQGMEFHSRKSTSRRRIQWIFVGDTP